ncbi:SDR family oxidoreductase [Jiella pacifica]|uniref:SDR family NAD(P)-dependent oxidoreductase n=1 Tax=Jiella pacifica TaxID=2696469 RepID=A0A6N9SYC8_9HYPH|nr:SDR family oxidoreductase [Jiella pacifica]NDW04103.1 SDR family NAD(P)-dependent oxidoreductase [Jiella pacifica]
MAELLNGKVAAVTGAASGIGLATTEALIAQGASVVMVDRDAAALAKITERLGDKAIAQVTDLLDAASCAAMVPEILAKTGRIDILHCNAGTYIGGDLTETDTATIDRMLNLNVNAVMKNVRDVIPHMIERKTGDIVVTCSVAGHMPIQWEPVYSGSKWAITCFVQTMRRQLNKHGIRVGQVSPGPVVSALLADWPADRLQAAKDSGSLIEPTEVSDAIIYMLTRSRNVTIRDMVVLPTNFDI